MYIIQVASKNRRGTGAARMSARPGPCSSDEGFIVRGLTTPRAVNEACPTRTANPRDTERYHPISMTRKQERTPSVLRRKRPAPAGTVGVGAAREENRLV